MDTTERVAVAIAALLLTHAAALYFRIEPIEEDIRRPLQAALRNQGMGGVAIAVEGRDVTLAGTVASASEAARAVALANQVEGVRVVREYFQIPR
jgi:osmotically-inducible protein OsmY